MSFTDRGRVDSAKLKPTKKIQSSFLLQKYYTQRVLRKEQYIAASLAENIEFTK